MSIWANTIAFTAILFAADPPPAVIADSVPDGFPRVAELRAITEGPKHHFFGYYGICPWNASGRYMVYLESEFGNRLVEEGEKAAIVLHDLETGERKAIAETVAWNFQQGALVHWLGETDRIIYNDRVDNVLKAIVLDVHSGDRRVLPRPIAAVSPDGKWAASINYVRLRMTRPDYGYAGEGEAYEDKAAPAEDGLYLMDVETGDTTMVVSLQEVYAHTPPAFANPGDPYWFNHVLFSRDSSRLFFLGRIHPEDQSRETAVFTVGLDGSDLRCIFPYAWGGSHFDWLDGDRVMVTTKYQAETPWRHVLVTDGKEDYRVIAPSLLDRDGHGHFSPDGQWMVTDSYPDAERYQHLYLVNMDTDEGAEIAKFQEPREYKGFWRCDLHPRWNRDGTALSFDSTHSGTRQVYVVDLTR